MSSREILTAKVSFFWEGGLVSKGATVRAGHPMLAGRGDLFEPVPVHFEHEAPHHAVHGEAATAVPGELRDVPPAAKRGPGRPRKNPVPEGGGS